MRNTVSLAFGSAGVAAMFLGGSIASGAGPELGCGVEHGLGSLSFEALEMAEGVVRGGSLCEDCVIEVHILVDVRLADELADTVEVYVDDVIAIMNETWSRPFSDGGLGVGVVLSELTVFENGDPWVGSVDRFEMLNNVAGYVAANIPINPDGRDAVIMLSGVQFDLTVGAGFVGTLCGRNAVGVVEAIFFETDFVALIANHQLGHVVGSFHDGSGDAEACELGEFIMGSLNPFSPAPRFSSCSISAMVGNLLRPGFDMISCLTPPQVSCLADFTGEGVLDFFDVSAFLQAFTSQDPIADFTGEGDFDFFDISAFLQSFAAGCP